MSQRMRSRYRLFRRILESLSFWLMVWNGLQCAFFTWRSAAEVQAYVSHRVHAYGFGQLQSAEDAFVRAIVWLWIMNWAEREPVHRAGGATVGTSD